MTVASTIAIIIAIIVHVIQELASKRRDLRYVLANAFLIVLEIVGILFVAEA